MNKGIKFGLLLMFILILSLNVFAINSNDNILYYSFDDDDLSGSNPLDLTPNDNDGTNNGATTGVTGKINQSFSFVTNDYLDTSTTPTYTNDFSFTGWFYKSGSTTGVNTWLASKASGSGFLHFYEGSGEFTLAMRDSASNVNQFSTTGVSVSTSTWYFLTYTFDATNKNSTFYVNSVREGTSSNLALNGIYGTDVVLGRNGNLNEHYLNGRNDEFAIWNKTLTQTEISELYNLGAGLQYPYLPDNFTISARDSTTSTNIQTFNATVNGTFYNTTIGLITLPYLLNESQILNITVEAEGYFNYFNETYNSSNPLVADLDRVTYSTTINGIELVSGNTINNFTINSTFYNAATTNGTIIIELPEGSNYFNITNPLGYYNKTNYEIVIPTTESENITFFNSILNITSFDLVQSLQISNFTANITSQTYGTSYESSTTLGEVSFNLIPDTYTLEIDSEGFAITYYNVTVNLSQNHYNATLYTTNSIRFEIYDEVSGNLINGTNMTIDIVGLTAKQLTTTNGTSYADLLVPNGYEIRYYSTNVDDYKLRSVFVTVDNRSTQSVMLYSLNETDTGITTATRTFNVFDENLDSVEGATVIVARYYSSSNSYVDVWQRKTDTNGQAIGQFETIDAFYRYRVVYNDEVKFISSESGTQFSTDGSTDIFINTATSLYDDYQDLEEVQYVPITFTVNPDNESGYFTFSFSYASVIDVCLEVQESSYSSFTTDETCVTSTGATIYYNVNSSGSTKTYLARAKIKVTDALGYQTVDTLSYKLGQISNPTGTLWTYNMTWLAILITIASLLIYIKRSPKVALIFQASTFLILTALPIKFVSIPVTVGVVAFCVVLLIIHNMRS